MKCPACRDVELTLLEGGFASCPKCDLRMTPDNLRVARQIQQQQDDQAKYKSKEIKPLS